MAEASIERAKTELDTGGAEVLKALIQMLIGGIAVVLIVSRGGREVVDGHEAAAITRNLFVSIGLALGAAAVVELAYALFTHGADEALNPLMPGISAALLVRLGQVDKFRLPEAIATALYVAALAGLFATRKHLAEVGEPEDFWKWLGRRRALLPSAGTKGRVTHEHRVPHQGVTGSKVDASELANGIGPGPLEPHDGPPPAPPEG
jgi:hypothetical protein